MIRINEHYLKLQTSYLFSDIAKKVAAYQSENPDQEIIRLGIGDVTRALPPACVAALHAAVDEMAQDATFRGYGPEQGYDFLRQKIAQHDFQDRGAQVAEDEIFVSDGAKCADSACEGVFYNIRHCKIQLPLETGILDEHELFFSEMESLSPSLLRSKIPACQ